EVVAAGQVERGERSHMAAGRERVAVVVHRDAALAVVRRGHRDGTGVVERAGDGRLAEVEAVRPGRAITRRARTRGQRVGAMRADEALLGTVLQGQVPF